LRLEGLLQLAGCICPVKLNQGIYLSFQITNLKQPEKGLFTVVEILSSTTMKVYFSPVGRTPYNPQHILHQRQRTLVPRGDFSIKINQPCLNYVLSEFWHH